MRNILKTSVAFAFMFLSGLTAQNLQIIHMDGVYDLDNDDLVEFIAFEQDRETGGVVSRVAYYEIDDLGFPQLIWNLDTPQKIDGNIVAARITDLNGSGTSELFIAANVKTADNRDFSQGVLYVYDWIGGGFSAEPALSTALTGSQSGQAISNVDIVDLEGDGKEELAIALTGPEAVVTIIGLSDGEERLFNEIQSFLLQDFSTSAGDVHVAGIDFDRDGLSDLFAFSPERNVLRIQSFLNSGGVLGAGPNLLHRVPGMSNILTRSLATLNWNSDETDDILIPFQSGHVISLSMVGQKIEVVELGIEAGPLSDLKHADFNQDGLMDLLLISGQQGIVTASYGTRMDAPRLNEYFSIASGEDSEGPQIFSVIPEIVDGIYLGTVIAGGWMGQQSEIFYFELGSIPEYPEEILVDTYIPQVRMEETIEEMPIVPPAEGQPLPLGILPTYVLPVNQTFAYTIPEEDDREFFSFRWVTPPPPRGMYFHYETKSVEWVPDDMQLGAYQLSFLLKMKVGETVDIIRTDEEGVVTYQVVPELATIESRFWIYVNDPPQIVSYPEETEFVAGDPFVYQVDVTDKNEDAFIRHTLEKAPEGMTIEQDGLLKWQTNASHIDIYDVRVIASDGFDRDVQSLKLYSRGQVVITSLPELSGTVGEEYRYKVNVRMPEDKQQELIYTLVYSPYGMMVDNMGQISWTPQSTQIDTQRFVIAANHGIAVDTQSVALFVNHPPILSSVPEPMTKIALNDTFNFQIVVDDPNEFDITRYEPIKLPKGMRMDPSTGRILWVPTEANLDFSTAEIEISDGHMSHVQSYDFFVNAPIQIISEPPTLGSVGESLTYEIGTKDLNEGSLMPYAKITPVYSVKNGHVFSVEIDDDVYRENIDRYIGEFKAKKSILIDMNEEEVGGEEPGEEEETVSRINLKRYIQDIFYEDDQLIVVIKRVGGRTVKIKDVLWHFFEGNKGKPPKVLVDRVPFVRYTLLDFPDGMFVDEYTGTISWTPSPNQYDSHTIAYMVSDGYTKDEQSFELYINHPPTIISTAPKTARVNDLYKYKVVVEDKNSDRELSFSLAKAPKGMQITRDGRISWNPTPSQINSRLFSIEVSDSYTTDIQETRLFVNISPNILTQPKPVALTNFEYRYRMVTEDLNGDEVKLRPVKIPKYARFDPDTGMFRWKPRMAQRGVNDIVIAAVDERGSATSHEFQVHVFEDPSSQQFISTSWPLLLAFVGTIFTVGVAALN